jgi:hypothetical protein
MLFSRSFRLFSYEISPENARFSAEKVRFPPPFLRISNVKSVLLCKRPPNFDTLGALKPVFGAEIGENVPFFDGNGRKTPENRPFFDEMGRKSTEMGQKSTEMGQKSTETAQNRRKSAENGRFLAMLAGESAENAHFLPEIASNRSQIAQNRSQIDQNRLKNTQNRPKNAQNRPKIDQNRPKRPKKAVISAYLEPVLPKSVEKSLIPAPYTPKRRNIAENGSKTPKNGSKTPKNAENGPKMRENAQKMTKSTVFPKPPPKNSRKKSEFSPRARKNRRTNDGFVTAFFLRFF